MARKHIRRRPGMGKRATSPATRDRRATRPADAAVDWYYHRNNCETCARSQAFLEAHGLTAARVQDARKDRIGRAEALKLARTAQKIVATRGAGVVEIDMRKALPTDAELARAIIGPTGNLRAPAILHGDTLLVGFNEAAYQATLTT